MRGWVISWIASPKKCYTDFVLLLAEDGRVLFNLQCRRGSYSIQFHTKTRCFVVAHTNILGHVPCFVSFSGRLDTFFVTAFSGCLCLSPDVPSICTKRARSTHRWVREFRHSRFQVGFPPGLFFVHGCRSNQEAKLSGIFTLQGSSWCNNETRKEPAPRMRHTVASARAPQPSSAMRSRPAICAGSTLPPSSVLIGDDDGSTIVVMCDTASFVEVLPVFEIPSR